MATPANSSSGAKVSHTRFDPAHTATLEVRGRVMARAAGWRGEVWAVGAPWFRCGGWQQGGGKGKAGPLPLPRSQDKCPQIFLQTPAQPGPASHHARAPLAPQSHTKSTCHTCGRTGLAGRHGRHPAPAVAVHPALGRQARGAAARRALRVPPRRARGCGAWSPGARVACAGRRAQRRARRAARGARSRW